VPHRPDRRREPAGRRAAIALVVLLAAAPATTLLAREAQPVRIRRPAPRPAERDRAELLGRLLMLEISVDVEAAPAREVLTLVARHAGINMVARWRTDRVAGMDPLTPITLRLDRVDPLSAIEAIVAQCAADIDQRCSWQLADGWIDVGPVSWLIRPSARFLRTHDVGSIIIDVPNFGAAGGGDRVRDSNGRRPGARRTPAEGAADLMKLIRAVIEPEAWRANGGEGAAMRWFRSALIIDAPDYIHRQIGGYPFRPIAPSLAPEPDVPAAASDGNASDEAPAVRVLGVLDARSVDPAAVRRPAVDPVGPAAGDETSRDGGKGGDGGGGEHAPPGSPPQGTPPPPSS
jgi:hypothetical protein